jgi:hypothetical protein
LRLTSRCYFRRRIEGCKKRIAKIRGLFLIAPKEKGGDREPSKLLKGVASIGKGFKLIALGMDTFYLWKSTQAMLKEVRE